MDIRKPYYANLALNLLKSAGFEAYVVGGCVRDSLLGEIPNDWDITTSALPEDTLKVFKDYRVIETGIKHGTVAVLIDDNLLEITTYRVDGEYKDNRHPENVTFTRNLALDLARRDFTINALACDADGRLIDEFGGVADLEAKRICCVGEPDERFAEDALRIMRALRFSATLDFDIEARTAKSIRRNKDLLKNIAAERITEELLKLLCGKGPRVTDILIEYRDVFAVIIPELEPCFDFDHQNIHHVYDIYNHIAYSVGASKPLPDVRLALLLHDIGKPHVFTVDENGTGHTYKHAEVSYELSKTVLSRLRLPTDFYETVLTLVRYHDYPVQPEKRYIKRRLNKFGPEILEKLMLVKVGDNAAHNMETGDFYPEIVEVQKLMAEVLAEGDCFSLKGLDITGNDIISLGYTGPKVGEILNELLMEVIEETIPNEHSKLIERAKEIGTGKA